jgi:hypothetical protein
MPNLASNNLDNRFVIILQDQKYYIEIWMYNQNSKFKPIPIPFTVVNNLVIEETLNDWNKKGFITLSNHFEFLERGVPENLAVLSDGTIGRDRKPSPFFFRPDGRNKISIKLFPIIDYSSKTNIQPLPEDKWNMNLDFIIYDIEDVSTGNSQEKLRKFYFHSEIYQILLERNAEWSSANNEYQSITQSSADSVRALSTSLAIRSLLKTAASNISDPKTTDIKVGSTAGPSTLDNPDIPFDNFDKVNWDLGDPLSKILYTCPANSCILEDLEYVSKFAKSQDGSPLFLLFDRYNRNWSLVSLKQIFTQAEDNQIERLTIEDGVDPKNSKPYVQRAPYDPNGGDSSTIKNFQSGVASRIRDYRFSPMVAGDEIQLKNTPVHNFDFSKSSFDINFKDNIANKLLDNYKKIANDSLYSFKDAKSGQILFQINQTKNKGLMTENAFVPRSIYPTDAAFLNMAKRFLLLSSAVFFSTVGLTIRTPGKFIFIDRETSDGDPNAFDDRFLGQWLVTKVTHIFTQESYTNEVIANKVDIFNKWFDEIDTKY